MARFHPDEIDDLALVDHHGQPIIVQTSDQRCARADCQRTNHVHRLTDRELLSLIAIIDILRLGDIADDAAEIWEWLHHPLDSHGMAPIDLLDEDRPEDWNLLASLLCDQANVEFVIREDMTHAS